MSTPVSTSANAAATTKNDGALNWESVVPKYVDYEDSMNPYDVQRVWLEMMKCAGLRSPNENKQLAFKLGVYVYGLLNGTSRVGSYAGKITLSDGTQFDAAVIPLATGKHSVRKFFRGNMEESYYALKTSGAVEKEQRFIARAASLGIPASAAFATADWMKDCPLFTPTETAAHEKAFTHSIERSKRSRGGRSLEAVEDQHIREGLEAQGKLNGEQIEF